MRALRLDSFHLLSRLQVSYEHLLCLRPVSVKSATGCTLAFMADAITQKQQGAPYDVQRTMALSSLAIFWNGP